MKHDHLLNHALAAGWGAPKQQGRKSLSRDKNHRPKTPHETAHLPAPQRPAGSPHDPRPNR
jgi:hypothetical protein